MSDGTHTNGGPEEPQGLECRKCGCVDFAVYYTRRRRGWILRRRVCRNCGRQMTTREKELGGTDRSAAAE